MIVYSLCNGASYAAMQRTPHIGGGVVKFGATPAIAIQRCMEMVMRLRKDVDKRRIVPQCRCVECVK